MKEDSGTKTCTESCKNADDDSNKNQGSDENGCPWWINSPDHGNCFWQYVQEKSGPDGSMPELVQSEIADLMGWSNTKTHFMLKQATLELVTALKAHKANQLLNQDHEVSIESNYNLEPIRPGSDEDE